MITIIINPRAGGASSVEAHARARLASAWLARAGIGGDVFVTTSRGHAHELARRAVARGDRTVVAWGGDGTVNEVGAALVESATALAIVPAGSGNGLARDLAVPFDPHDALDCVRSSLVRTIDAGQVNGRWFFCVAGAGFDACVAAAFDRDAGTRRGFISYARLTARELLRYRAADYRIDGRSIHRAFLITFANASQFGNGARIAPDARLDDGELEMVVFAERSRLTTIVNLPRLFTGKISRVPGVSITRVREAVVVADEPMTVHVDGEPLAGVSEIRVNARRGVLRVVAREGDEASARAPGV